MNGGAIDNNIKGGQKEGWIVQWYDHQPLKDKGLGHSNFAARLILPK